MRAFSVLASVLASSLLALACVRERKLVDRFVEEYCEARWSCGCDSPGLTQIECESSLTQSGDEAQQAAQDAGLAYDRECAKAWLDAADDSCAVEPVPAIVANACGSPCLPYHGDRAEGEACESFGPWSSCAGHLRCGYSGRCEDPCAGQRDGDHCDFDVGYPCGPEKVCGPDGGCTPAPVLGEPCELLCRNGAACDRDQRVCVEAPGFGDSCQDLSPCKRGLRCVDGVCDVGSPAVCSLESPW